MRGGLSKGEAEAAVQALFADKAKVQAARAEGKISNEIQALAGRWSERMEHARIETAIMRKQAAINMLRRRDLNARQEGVKAEGYSGMDGIEALLVGSEKRFPGARDSVDAARVAVKKDFLGGLISDLEALDAGGQPVRGLLETDAFNADVVREVIKPGGTGDTLARQVADILSRHMEKARLRMNAAGASIGKLVGYLPQSHDAWKLTRGEDARARWIASIRDKLDLERSFETDAATAATAEGRARITEVLSHIYDNITLGRDTGPTATERGARTGPANLAGRLARHRVLHFKDADAFLAYHAEYGRGGVLTGVLAHLDNAARSTALMEKLGTNPEMMLQSLIAQETRLLREKQAGGAVGKAETQALKDLQTAQGLKHGKVAAWWAELTGEANWPANTSAARIFAVARATQSLGKLGGAALSAVADVFNVSMNIRVHGVSWPEALRQGISLYFKQYSGQEREIARQVGGFIDDVGAEMRLRWDVHEALPGKLAGIQDKFFKWSGLNWITETGKAGYALWFSGHIGEVTGKAWGEIDAARRATLAHHGITERRWDLLRRMTETAPDGRTLLVPKTADDIPDDVLRAHLADEIKRIQDAAHGEVPVIERAEARLFERTRNDLRTEVMSMIADETQYAVLEPGAKTRAVMRQGTRPGTVAGEFWRFAMQFKSFPIAYMQRNMGGRRWITADRAAQLTPESYGWGNVRALGDAVRYDPRGAVGAALSAFVFGYIAMTLKDVSKGRTPKQLWDEKGFKPETVFAALMQSGGLGIIGDFFLNKADRFGNSFAGTLAGPFAGEAGKLVNVGSLALRGDLSNAGEEGLRFAMNNAPFLNLRYTREAFNWLAGYHLREMMSPGTLARTERALKKDFGQSMFVSPADNIQKGGGFR
jgi:hypothetical protein